MSSMDTLRSIAHARTRKLMAAGEGAGIVAAFEAFAINNTNTNNTNPFINYVGPAPPRTWTTRPVITRRRTATTPAAAIADANSSDSASVPDPQSLLTLAANTVARTIHFSHKDYAQHLLLIKALPFHLKQLLLATRSKLCRDGETSRLPGKIFLAAFLDPHLRVLDLSNSDIDLSTLRAFLPAMLPRISSKKPIEHIPDSWDDDDDSGEDSFYDGEEHNSRISNSGAHNIHTLDLSFTRFSNTTPNKLCKTIVTLLPNLYRLSIAGFLPHDAGPSFLHQITHGLINLVVLDISFNLWVDESVIEGLPIEQVLGKLDMLIVKESACDKTWLISHVRSRKPQLQVIV
ncbi:hypothetical protein HK100_004906 [Physocladia obscura]|uniref:Uncharacterized protein n=1 Tax=Physocladia obscura TaxID=109957 RepID=A0AAD5X8G4_9FUNG|nr:hypothetical protein HK100_004906 [Physocladia obscura]